MKLKIRRKPQPDLVAELFNPPHQIPEGVFNVKETTEGYIGEVKLGVLNPITQIVRPGMYIVYSQYSTLALDEIMFNQSFEILEEINS